MIKQRTESKPFQTN